MPFTPRLFLRVAGLALAIATAQGAVVPLTAQGRSVEDARTVDAYQLTMPTLRKVLPALYAEGADACEQQKRRDPRTLSIAQMTRSLERCAPVLRALERAEVTPREAAIVLAALYRASEQVALRGGKTTSLPPGVLRDNALLLERNDPEIRRLTKTGAPT
ncbi:MAG TPA: hypothetical protein VFG66_08585 [Gemmatimonadales bacterium]|nr:hypothetical protein [Gemmatimonadales bacterium]